MLHNYDRICTLKEGKGMFGEEPIFGSVERVVDSKKRLALPTFTNVDAHELLYLVQEEDGSINIYGKKEIDELLFSMNEITQSIINSSNVNNKKIKTLKKNKEKILYLFNSFYCNTSSVRTDNYKRINLSKSSLEPNKKYKLIGKGNSLLICNSIPSDFSICEKIKTFTR